ncbi:hypothetical protein BDW75DRAFT_246163 [Aspergillus navahoensis]
MVMETAQGCDHYLHGVGGLEASLDDFRIAYQQYLESQGGTLTKRLHHDIDAEAFALSRADVYTVYPIPMSDARTIRFMAPWVPRAHRGHGERLVIETTLVAPRDVLPTDPDSALHEIRVDGGVFLADIYNAHKDHTTSRLGPWGNPHPLRAIPAWPAWQALSGISPLSDALVGLRRHDTPEVIVMKNVLFTTDPNQANQRWALIDQVRRAIADAAKLALESFIRTEAALFPNNGYQSNEPAPIPDEEWVTLTDRDAIRTFDLPAVGNIYQQDADDDWISDTETNPSESELELASHRPLPSSQRGNQRQPQRVPDQVLSKKQESVQDQHHRMAKLLRDGRKPKLLNYTEKSTIPEYDGHCPSSSRGRAILQHCSMTTARSPVDASAGAEEAEDKDKEDDYKDAMTVMKITATTTTITMTTTSQTSKQGPNC